MSQSWLVGALLGLVAAIGAVIAVRAMPPMRPVRLADRIAPYLADTPPPSRLLAAPDSGAAPFAVIRKLFGPALRDLVRLLDRLVGGTASVRRRLTGLGSDLAVEDFRIEQVLWGAAGLLGGGVTHRGPPRPGWLLRCGLSWHGCVRRRPGRRRRHPSRPARRT